MNKDLYFEHMEEFADYIISRVEDVEWFFVTVVGKFETIKPLLKEVMIYDSVDIDSIEIESGAVDGYADEFVLSLWAEDNVINIGCEKLKRDGEYIAPGGDENYLMEDCSSKVIPLCKDSDLYFVNLGDESDCCEECDGHCFYCHCFDDKEAGNIENTVYYIYPFTLLW